MNCSSDLCSKERWVAIQQRWRDLSITRRYQVIPSYLCKGLLISRADREQTCWQAHARQESR